MCPQQQLGDLHNQNSQFNQVQGFEYVLKERFKKPLIQTKYGLAYYRSSWQSFLHYSYPHNS
jgi:hypothetical protein